MISPSQKKLLIQKHPCFTSLNAKESEAFAALFTEENIPSHQHIVVENELVDCIYIIASGTANVIKEGIAVCILNPGEAIGLSETGLYSETGKRTATIESQTNMILLRLDLSSLHQFVQEHPHINDLMRKNVDIVNRMNLIKAAAPFAKLTIDEVRYLAEQVTKLTIPATNILFHKGDPGDQCFLIQAGEVEIFDVNENKTEHSLAILTPPMVFGEAALLTELPRNASARAVKNTELLAINRDVLFGVIESKKDVGTAMMKLVKSRKRPLRLSYIESHFQETHDKEKIITLKDPQHDTYYRLADEGWFIWELLDGKHTLQDISIAFNEKYQVFDPGMVAGFIMDLEEEGFVEKITSQWDEDDVQQPLWIRFAMFVRRVMEASISFGKVDQWISSSYKKFIFIFYTYPAQLLIAIMVLSGFFIFVKTFNLHVDLFRHTQNSSWLIIAAASLSLASTFLHELAHAYTTKTYGRNVANFGIGWFWLGPVAFCDTSDMWLSNKRQRLMVDLAGLYTDSLMAGIASWSALFLSNPYIILVLWLFSFFLYLGIFKNLSPLIELDGYYALMDLLGKDNLRESAINWLVEDFWATLKNRTLLKKYYAEIIYWVWSIFYLALEVIVPYIVMNVLLYGLFGTKNPYLSLLLPIVVVTFSSLSILADIRRRRREICT